MVGNGLGTVNDDRNAILMCHGYHLLYWIDGSQHIGNMRNRHHLRSFFQQFFVTIQVQHAFVVHWHDEQLTMMALHHLLPRHEVGVVLHGSDEYF